MFYYDGVSVLRTIRPKAKTVDEVLSSTWYNFETNKYVGMFETVSFTIMAHLDIETNSRYSWKVLMETL